MRPCIICCIIDMQDCGMFCIIARHCSGIPDIICPMGIWLGLAEGNGAGADGGGEFAVGGSGVGDGVAPAPG